jgi:hypothetical protein
MGSSNGNNLTGVVSNNNLNYGVYMGSSLNRLNNITTNSNNMYGLSLSTDASNIAGSNIVSNNNVFGGITLASRNSNNTFYNITVINNSLKAGIELSSGFNNSFMNILSNNNQYGISLANGSGYSFKDAIISNNLIVGIDTYTNCQSVSLFSTNTSFTNITITNTSSSGGMALDIACVSNFSFNNITVDSNWYGFRLYRSNLSVIQGLISKNNYKYGFILEEYSYNNTLTNSFIQYNNLSGFSLNSSGGTPQNNFIYNNYFNNSAQYSNVSTSSINYFNTTLTSGTNIVGGNYLAGNYWAALNGTGFSQTCIDRGDGICSTSNNLDGVNYDYLPLTCYESWGCGDWGSCANGRQTRSCRDSNLCQTYRFKPAESQTCSVDLGGHIANSGGSGGGSTFTSLITNIVSNKPVEIIINNSQMDLSSLKLNIKKSISNSSMTILKLNDSYGLTNGLPIGKLYQAFEIEPGINNSDIINATLNFKINRTWLAENNITFHYKGSKFWLIQNDIVGNIILYRHPTGANSWMPLTTSFLSEDNQSYHFSAYSKGFSTFAIFFNKYDCMPNSARCDGNDVQLCLGNSTWLVTETCSDVCNNGRCQSVFFKSNQFYTILITVISGIIAIVVIVLISKKVKKKKKFNHHKKGKKKRK